MQELHNLTLKLAYFVFFALLSVDFVCKAMM